MATQHASRKLHQCPSRETLVAFQDGSATGVDEDVLMQHIESCDSCASVLEEIDSLLPADRFLDEVRACLAVEDDAVAGYAVFERAVRELHLTPLANDPRTAPNHFRPTFDEFDWPQTIGAYEVLDRLGTGGMGVVYKARQSAINRVVALKMILSGAHAGSSDIARFRVEGEAIARMQHPGIVQIFDLGFINQLPYFTMEFVEGGSLRSRMERTPMSVREAVTLVRDLAEAVAYAHDHNVIHRDLKPSNILLTRAGRPKIGDFGLAKILDVDTEITASETLIGTPAYMSPEQATGQREAPTPAIDIWALGVILYELLTKSLPFAGTCRAETLGLIRNADPVPPSRRQPGIPRDLDAVCLKCLEKRPSQRYDSAHALAEDLDRVLAGEPTSARPANLVRRLGRMCRRHVAAAMMFVFLGITLGVGLAARGFDDPDRHLRQIEAEVADGSPVELIGETGQPRWFRTLTGHRETTQSLGDDGCFTVHSWDYSLVCLLPQVSRDTYTFSADVRHNRTETTGFVGLFCMHGSIPEDPKSFHQTVEFVFNDLRSVSDIIGGEGIFGKKLPHADLNYARLSLRGFNGDINTACCSIGLGAGPRFQPHGSRKTPNPWYRLEVKVSPEGIVPSWNGDPLATIDSKRLQQAVQRVIDYRSDIDPAMPTLPAASPNGGLGLLVNRSSAAFRNVRIDFGGK